MTYQDAKTFQLFDLLARQWMLSSAIEGAVFNQSDTAVAIACCDGRVSIILTEDEESPNSRVRHAVDSGRQTIQPRKGKIPPVQKVVCKQQRTSPIVAYGKNNFLFGSAKGQLTLVTPQGEARLLETATMKGPVIALASRSDGTMHCCAAGQNILVYLDENMKTSKEIQAERPVTALAFSPDGLALAVAHEAGVTVWDMSDDDLGKLNDYPLDSPPQDVCWSAEGQWIACTLAASGFVLINRETHLSKQFSDFPTAVNTLSFSTAANAIATSGAFRAAAWSLRDLLDNDNDNNNAALNSGKPGLIAVDCIAASPSRNILAVGYANGLLSLTQIGHQEEMPLAHDNNMGISVLSWSKSGAFLVIGRSDGETALVEFPDGMFK